MFWSKNKKIMYTPILLKCGVRGSILHGHVIMMKVGYSQHCSLKNVNVHTRDSFLISSHRTDSVIMTLFLEL